MPKQSESLYWLDFLSNFKFIYDLTIEAEAAFDGFYAVCTNLEDDLETIVGVNKRRWEIEECFRIMKTDFEARPVSVQRKDQILGTLREMDFIKYEGRGYQPVYTRTEVTDALHEEFGFCTISSNAIAN